MSLISHATHVLRLDFAHHTWTWMRQRKKMDALNIHGYGI